MWIYYLYEKIILKNGLETGCCKLCCESISNYCDQVVCDTFYICFYYQCCCCCFSDCDCDYLEKDYNKNSQFFCYCYQAQIKCFWCNNFITNETSKKIFPFMLQYFLLQLISI